MSNVIVVTFLAFVAVVPIAYLAFIASALKSSDNQEFVTSAVK